MSTLFKLAAVTNKDLDFKDVKVTDSVKKLLRNVRPGDILLSKQDDKTRTIANKLQGWWTGSRWTHVGLASGKGRTSHAYSGIKGWRPGGEKRVRLHQIASLPKLHRDVVILRPQVGKKSRRYASRFAKDTVGTPYSYGDWLRSAFWRGKAKPGEARKVPKKMTCTTQVAYAYPKLKFKGTSRRHLRPEDFLYHRRIKPVLAFSAEKNPMQKTASARLRELLGVYKQAAAGVDTSFRPPPAPKPAEPAKIDKQPEFKPPKPISTTAGPDPRAMTKGWRPPAKT